MADPQPPNFRDKREILHGPGSTDADRIRTAGAYAAADRFGEALELLERSPDDALLERITAEATRRGDTFLLARIEKIRGRPFEPPVWREAAERAERTGRFLDACRAFERAGDPERAEALRAAEIPGPAPVPPEGRTP
jgi:hypothetical protein